jgi:hypothetical protein
MKGRLAMALLCVALLCVGYFLVPLTTCAQTPLQQTGGPEAGSGNLAYRFQEGDVQTYRLLVESEQKQDVGPFQRSVQETFFTQKVTAVEDGVATLELVCDSLRIDAQAGPGSFSFDSRTGAGNVDDLQKNLFSAIVGRPCTLRVDSRGKVLDAQGFDAPFDEIASEAGDNPFTAQIVEAQKQAFGDEAMRQTFTHAFLRLPDRELSRGDRWKETEEIGIPIGRIAVASDSLLEGFEDKGGVRCARVRQTGTATLVSSTEARFGDAIFDHELESADLLSTYWMAADGKGLRRSESEIRMQLRVVPRDAAGDRPDSFLPEAIGVSTFTRTVLERLK